MIAWFRLFRRPVRRLEPLPAPPSDPLEVLADGLARNAVAFRRQGNEQCAQQAEQILLRLREAMARAVEAA